MVYTVLLGTADRLNRQFPVTPQDILGMRGPQVKRNYQPCNLYQLIHQLLRGIKTFASVEVRPKPISLSTYQSRICTAGARRINSNSGRSLLFKIYSLDATQAPLLGYPTHCITPYGDVGRDSDTGSRSRACGKVPTANRRSECLLATT